MASSIMDESVCLHCNKPIYARQYKEKKFWYHFHNQQKICKYSKTPVEHSEYVKLKIAEPNHIEKG